MPVSRRQQLQLPLRRGLRHWKRLKPHILVKKSTQALDAGGARCYNSCRDEPGSSSCSLQMGNVGLGIWEMEQRRFRRSFR